MGKLAIIIWISVAILLVLITSLIPPIFFSKSWWWFGGTLISLIIIALLGLAIYFIVRMLHKEPAKEESQSKKITDEEASKIVDKILKEQYADHFISSEEKITNEGSGQPKTPVFHKFGKGYHEPYYYFLINMVEPATKTKLKMEENESSIDFGKRVSEAISKFASEPERMIIDEIEKETEEGRIITRRVRTDLAELEKKQEEKEAEETEEI